jgi:hypothetical protein
VPWLGSHEPPSGSDPTDVPCERLGSGHEGGPAWLSLGRLKPNLHRIAAVIVASVTLGRAGPARYREGKSADEFCRPIALPEAINEAGPIASGVERFLSDRLPQVPDSIDPSGFGAEVRSHCRNGLKRIAL